MEIEADVIALAQFAETSPLNVGLMKKHVTGVVASSRKPETAIRVIDLNSGMNHFLCSVVQEAAPAEAGNQRVDIACRAIGVSPHAFEVIAVTLELTGAGEGVEGRRVAISLARVPSEIEQCARASVEIARGDVVASGTRFRCHAAQLRDRSVMRSALRLPRLAPICRRARMN